MLPLVLCAAALCAVGFQGATRTKAFNTDALNLASSWTNGVVPSGSDVALFESTITGPLTLALGAETAWSQISYANPAGDRPTGSSGF